MPLHLNQKVEQNQRGLLLSSLARWCDPFGQPGQREGGVAWPFLCRKCRVCPRLRKQRCGRQGPPAPHTEKSTKKAIG